MFWRWGQQGRPLGSSCHPRHRLHWAESVALTSDDACLEAALSSVFRLQVPLVIHPAAPLCPGFSLVLSQGK